jgi:hypothetical protein
MYINTKKEERSTIRMDITNESTIINITHNMLYTQEGHIGGRIVIHGKKNTGKHLDSETYKR